MRSKLGLGFGSELRSELDLGLESGLGSELDLGLGLRLGLGLGSRLGLCLTSRSCGASRFRMWQRTGYLTSSSLPVHKHPHRRKRHHKSEQSDAMNHD